MEALRRFINAFRSANAGSGHLYPPWEHFIDALDEFINGEENAWKRLNSLLAEMVKEVDKLNSQVKLLQIQVERLQSRQTPEVEVDSGKPY